MMKMQFLLKDKKVEKPPPSIDERGTWLLKKLPTFQQVTIWGDYGRVEGKKVFMGVAQIMLDDLDLSNIVIGWYKLFGTSSLVSVPPGGGKDRPSSAAGKAPGPTSSESMQTVESQ